MLKFSPSLMHNSVVALLFLLSAGMLSAQQQLSRTQSTGMQWTQEWSQFSDASLYFNDFTEITRVAHWVFTAQTPSGTNYSSLQINQQCTLIVNSVPNPEPCVNRCTPKAELFLYFHAGGDKRTYEVARRNSIGGLMFWATKCTVDIVLQDIGGGTGNLPTYRKVMEIDNDNPEQLCVIDVTQMFPSFCGATGRLPKDILDRIKIKIVEYNPPADINVQPVIRLEAGFKENLNVDARRQGGACAAGTGDVIEVKDYTFESGATPPRLRNTFHNTDNTELTFEWRSLPGICTNDTFPNYQFQLLRLYNTNPENLNPSAVYCTVDWSRALTLETGSTKQSLTLTIPEGPGFYIWRVRPVGNFYEGGITNPRNWGCWTPSYADGDVLDAVYENNWIYVSSNNSAILRPMFFYQQFDNELIWGYQRSFNETGNDGLHISEGITYLNKLLSPVQTQAKNPADNTVVGMQTVYDNVGRPSLQTMAAPLIQSTGNEGFDYQQELGYKSQLLQNTSNQLYTASDYKSAIISAASPSPARGSINDYYSDANNNLGVPSAGGYPFSTVSYYRDGRVKESGGVGYQHRIGSNHTTRVYYGSVTNEELVSIFGDEAPSANSVGKAISVGADGVASVSYISKAGEVLATCLTDAGELPETLEAGNVIPENTETPALDNLVGETVNVLHINDEVTGGELLNESTFRSAKTHVLMKPTTVYLTYEINPEFFSVACLNYCGTCDYSVTIRIVDAVTGVVVYEASEANNPALALHPASGTSNGSGCTNSARTPLSNQAVSLPAGTYVIERIIRTNTKSTDGNPKDADQFHVDKIALTMQSLDQILTELSLLPNGTTPPQLATYINYRNMHNHRYNMIDVAGNWCGWIDLPDGGCSNGCPSVSGGFPEFEQYLFTELTGKSTGKLNDVFRNPDGSNKFPEPFPKYFLRDENGDGITEFPEEKFPEGSRMFDELVRNMIADGYSCNLLWKKWQAAVAYFKASRGTGGGVPQFNGRTVDLMELFLEYVLTDLATEKVRADALKGRRPNAYGTNISGSEGYISHAYKYFKYKTGDNSLCETAIGNKYPDLITQLALNTEGPSDSPVAYPIMWNEIFTCVKSTGLIKAVKPKCEPLSASDFPIMRTTDTDLENAARKAKLNQYIDCIKEPAREVQKQCKSHCEEMRGDFQQAILDEYGSTIPTLSDLQCMVDALVKNCTNGCEVAIEVTFTNGEWPNTLSDIIVTMPTSQQNDAVARRIGGVFSVRRSVAGACSTATNDPDPFEHASGGVSLNTILAQYLTEYFEQVSATCTSVCTVNFYQKAMEFLGVTGTPPACMGTANDWGILTSFEIYPGAEGAFTVKGPYANGVRQPCCRLEFASSRKVTQESLLQQSVDNLNNMLNSLWGMPLSSYTPVYAADVATTNFLSDTTGGVPATGYKHSYYRANGIDPWKDTLRWYNGVLRQPVLGTPQDGIPIFKLIAGGGDGDYSNELSGVIASKVTDVFATSGTWRAYGTIVLQMPRKSLDEPIQKLVVRLTRADADAMGLARISIDTKVGDKTIMLSNRMAATTSMDELLFYTNKTFTDAVGQFILTPSGKINFSLKGDLGQFTADPVYTISSKATVTFPESCIACSPANCGICIAWHEPTVPWPFDGVVPTSVDVLSCEEKEVERIKDLIVEQYDRIFADNIKNVQVAYKTTCGDPSKIEDKLKVKYDQRNYHYTLFYYDRAGNTVRTVQPKGVDLANAGTRTRNDHPNHTFETRYQHNSSGQTLISSNPDGGESRAWYNDIGQPKLSQTAAQRNAAPPRYNYVDYDILGRVVESGEITEQGGPVAMVKSNTLRGNKFITRIFYDEPIPKLPEPYGSLQQHNVHNSVSWIVYDESYDASLEDPANLRGYPNPVTDVVKFNNWLKEKQANFSSYSEQGLKEWDISQHPIVYATSFPPDIPLTAKTEYEYNIPSGTLAQVSYQKGYKDQFFQRGSYDASDRLKFVETSRDGKLWDKDAEYEFYLHGPLKRTIIGEDSVQGTDFVYTINGWLKGINHPSQLIAKDPGGDGNAIPNAVNTTRFAPDGFGMALEYFGGDFERSYQKPDLSAPKVYSPFNASGNPYLLNLVDSRQLYGGIITGWSTNTRPPVNVTTNNQFENLTGYMLRYDVLGRLKDGKFATFPGGVWVRSDEYREKHAYDPNGNHLKLERWAMPAGGPPTKKMDDFNFAVANAYDPGTNRLRYFTEDPLLASGFNDDIDAQSMPTNNYQYDADGRITRDCQEGVETTWDSFDRVVQVINYNYSGGLVPDCNSAFTPNDKSIKIVYRYDAAGRKTIREEYEFNTAGNEFYPAPSKATHYVYSAAGLLAVYEQKGINTQLIEWPMYGMGRVGLAQPESALLYSYAPLLDDGMYERYVAHKLYELTDHLGNVRAAISDIKPIDQNGNFQTDVLSYTNYYPYGLPQPNRLWTDATSAYRFGFNGVEKENATYNNGISASSGEGKMLAMDFRMYDARLGRWWGQDPIVNPGRSPYAGMGSDPVNRNDPSGLLDVPASGNPKLDDLDDHRPSEPRVPLNPKDGDSYVDQNGSNCTFSRFAYGNRGGWIPLIVKQVEQDPLVGRGGAPIIPLPTFLPNQLQARTGIDPSKYRFEYRDYGASINPYGESEYWAFYDGKLIGSVIAMQSYITEGELRVGKAIGPNGPNDYLTMLVAYGFDARPGMTLEDAAAADMADGNDPLPLSMLAAGVSGKIASKGVATIARAETNSLARAEVNNLNKASQKGLWTLTAEKSEKIKYHDIFKKIFKSLSDGLWWSVDNAKHGKSQFKVFKETSKGLEWIHDADEFGNFIVNKHKGETGKFIPWSELKTIK